MKLKNSQNTANQNLSFGLVEKIRKLYDNIIQYTSNEINKIDLLKEIFRLLSNFFKCDGIEIWIKEDGPIRRYDVSWFDKKNFHHNVFHFSARKSLKQYTDYHNDYGIMKLSRDILNGNLIPTADYFTINRSFWTSDLKNPMIISGNKHKWKQIYKFNNDNKIKTLVIIPFILGKEIFGLLQVRSDKTYFFSGNDIELIEELTKYIGVILLYKYRQSAMHERVKELTCLYGMAQLTDRDNITIEEIIYNTIELLHPAWQYPEITSARIFYDGQEYYRRDSHDIINKMSANIIIRGKPRGYIEIGYIEEKPEFDEGPFLKEERNLLETVAKELSLIIERKESIEEKEKLQEQLRHADRMATVGELSAGVAHELNEPIGSILGFAQLAIKTHGLPLQVKEDLEKIIKSSLHSREVIKKLMFFSRQLPPRKTEVNLNKLIEEGLYFLESRCNKEGIEVNRSYCPDLPAIIADPVQLNQVLVNLVVNAIQAMPEGGKLTIKTSSAEDYVSLIVQDTGIGMGKEIMNKVFEPFFTTKEIGKGTGLGLSVVHGIVTSHNGTIHLESNPGKGTIFEVSFPVL
ncbi:MAG: hypothetical protein HY738_22630 [Bacteroidia bacterium]|nr:hypothetical protein [Bacteroidia bacterium]